MQFGKTVKKIRENATITKQIEFEALKTPTNAKVLQAANLLPGLPSTLLSHRVRQLKRLENQVVINRFDFLLQLLNYLPEFKIASQGQFSK